MKFLGSFRSLWILNFFISFLKSDSVDFDCLNKPNGKYSDPINPCSNHYFECVDGRMVEQTCSVRSDIVDEPPVPIDEFCRNRKPGNYPEPNSVCSQMIYVCSEEKELTIRWCSFNQYYERVNDTCLPYDKVPGCASTPTPGTTFNTVITAPEPEFDCAGRHKGSYPDPKKQCSDRFFVCDSRGQVFQRQCPYLTAFDVESKHCTVINSLPSCRDLAATTIATDTASTRPSFLCANRKKGNHADPDKPCSSRFFTCASDGRMFERYCTNEFVFVESVNDCISPDSGNLKCH